MAKISKPTFNRKGTPPPELEAGTNLARVPDEELRPLNFKVRAEFKREFKSYATQLDMSMVDLLQACFEYYRIHH